MSQDLREKDEERETDTQSTHSTAAPYPKIRFERTPNDGRDPNVPDGTNYPWCG